MGRATVYCEQCGELIPEADFLGEKAVTVRNKHYCRKCKAAVAHLIAEEPLPPASRRSSATVPAVRRPVSRRSSGILPAVGDPAGRKRTPSKKKRSSGVLPAVRPGARAGRHSSAVRGKVGEPTAEDGSQVHETRRYRRQKDKRTQWIALGVGGGVILLAVIGLVMHSISKKKEQQRIAARNADGAAAVQEVRDHLQQQPGDFEGAIRRLTDAQLRFQGTPSQGDADNLRRELQEQRTQQVWREEQWERFRVLRKEKPSDPAEVITKLQTLRREVAVKMPEDFGRQIEEEIERVRRYGFGKEMERIDRILADDPKAYDKVIDGLTDLGTQADVPTDVSDEIRSRIDRVRLKRDEDAAKTYQEIEQDVLELLQQHLYEQAMRRAEGFPSEFGATSASRDVAVLKQRVRDEEAQYKKSQEQPPKPPPGGGDKPPPPPPAGGGIVLYDGTSLNGWTLVGGGQITVEHRDGTLVARHSVSEPAKDEGGSVNYNEFVYCNTTESWSEYDIEFDLMVERFEFGLMVRWVAAPGNQPGWASRMGPPSGMPLGQWVHFCVEVRDSQASVVLDGQRQSYSYTAGGGPPGGVAFAMPAGAAVQVRNIRGKQIR
ncbi:MAG: hypothetical protein ABIH26_05980 [Candidatus Eisenbacteria bacterium]